MFLEDVLVIKDTCTVCNIRQCIRAIFRNKFQFFFHVQICWLDIGNALKIRDIHEQIRVQEVGIVYITANADDVRIIFPNQSGFQNRNGFVWGFDGQVNVVMGGIEAFFHRFKCCNCFRFVLQQFHFNLSIAGLTRTASLQQQCGKRNACQNQTTNCISFFHDRSSSFFFSFLKRFCYFVFLL